jgi:hypothetical protein
MKPNMDSMVDELLQIKLAEEDQRESWKFPGKAEWGQVAKNMLAYGAGMGVGSGLGYALKKKVFSKLLPQMSDNMLNALGYGSGALAGLAGTAAFKRALKSTEEKRREQR